MATANSGFKIHPVTWIISEKTPQPIKTEGLDKIENPLLL